MISLLTRRPSLGYYFTWRGSGQLYTAIKSPRRRYIIGDTNRERITVPNYQLYRVYIIANLSRVPVLIVTNRASRITVN